MIKSRPSIAAAASAEAEPEARPYVSERRNVKTVNVQKQETSGRLPHTSFYATPAVLKALKEIAVARDCKVHDLLNEAVKRVMEENGKDFDRLSKRQ
jgi:hypothetical protein